MDRQRGRGGQRGNNGGQRSNNSGRGRGRSGDERTQRNEEFRNNINSDLNPEREFRGRGGRGGERGGRGGRGGFRGGAQGGFRNSRPRMVPTMDIKDIKLNEAQAQRIKELDEQITALGKLTEPLRDELDKKIEVVDNEMNNLRAQAATYDQQIQEQYAQKEEYIKKNNPDFANIQSIRDHLQEMFAQRDGIKAEIKKLEDKRSDIHQKIQKINDNTGFKSARDASVRLEKIEIQIETQTLTNNELKKLLGEKERLRKNIPDLDELEPLQKQRSEIKDKIDAKYSELHEVSQEISEYVEKRTTATEQKKSVNNETTKFKDQITAFKNKKQEIFKQVDQKKKEKKELFNQYYQSLGKYKDDLNRKRDLEYEKNTIYVEAERIMLQIEEGKKKIGTIREKVNPHEEDIKAASRIAIFLENQLDSADDKEEINKQVHGKLNDDETQRLIESCHNSKKGKKNKKRGNQNEKAKANLTFSVEDISDFARLNVPIPKKLEEIPDTLKALRAKISEWNSSFVKAVVNVTANEDGSVAVRVRLN